MSVFKSVKDWIKKSIKSAEDLLVPEKAKVRSLLQLDPGLMRELLPKSAVLSKETAVLFDYQNEIVRLIVKSIKYKNNRDLRKRAAAYLYEEFLDISSEIALFEGNPPLLLPMPMSRKEKRERGFNQCEELAREIKKLGGENIEVSYSALQKIRETERQTKLSRGKREQNVKGSMIVPTESVRAVRGRVCVVLDDVYTTGATLAEARRALLSAGAKRIVGLFIAH